VGGGGGGGSLVRGKCLGWCRVKHVAIGLMGLIIVVCAGACCTDIVPYATVATNQAPAATRRPTPAPIPTTVSPPLTPTPTLAATACDRLAFASGSGIYVVNTDGSDLVHVADTPDGYTPIGIQWSPDGKRLAYLNAEVDNPWAMSLCVVNADGTGQRLLSDWPGGLTYGWSPDSQYIWSEHCSRAGECTFTLQSVEIGGGGCGEYYLPGLTRCISECFPLKLSDGRWWSSHREWGRTMVVASEDHLWALCPEFETVGYSRGLLSPDEAWVAFGPFIDDVSIGRIAESSGENVYTPQAAGSPHCGIGAWSPDARSFAFATYEGDKILVWTVDPIEKAESLVARLEGRECPEDIKWSADSRHISLLVDDYVDNGGSSRIVRVCTVSVPDGEVSCLPLGEVPERCSWSPGGYWLACAGADLTVLLSIGGEQVDLTTLHTRGIEWSPTGRWLAFSTDEYPLTDDDGEGLYVFDLVTRETMQLSHERTPGFAFSPSCR